VETAETKTENTNAHPVRRKIVKYLLFFVSFLVVLDIILLLWLYFSVGIYKNFWIRKAKESGEVTYLALGDSAAQGIGASSPMRGYVGLIAKQLEAASGKKVRVVNVSESGATVLDVINKQIPKIKDVKPDFVTIEIGANDVGIMKPEDFKRYFGDLLPQLPAGTFVSNMPLFNSRPSKTEPAREYSRIIEELVKKDKRLRFVDLQKETEEHQSIFGFAPDFFHPNNLSYKNWYRAFWNEIQKN